MSIRFETNPISLTPTLKFYRIRAFGGSPVDILRFGRRLSNLDSKSYFFIIKTLYELIYMNDGGRSFGQSVMKIRKRHEH